MNKKFQDRWYVEKELNLTPRQLDRAIEKMKLRHPKENWIYVREPSNNQITMYCSLEFVEWLKDVYLRKDKYYLDLEIAFYEKRIKEMEEELNIPHHVLEYNDMTKKEMMDYFGKNRNNIEVAISKMCSRYSNDMKFVSGDTTMIKAEGIKFINEKYYRKSYLEYLENLKHSLEVEYGR